MTHAEPKEGGFERLVDQLTAKDVKEGDQIRITTKSGSTYEFLYTAGMLVAKGEGHTLAKTFGSFKDVRAGEHLDFGLHRTSRVQGITHIRPSTKEAIMLSPEASLAVRAKMKLAMAGSNGVALSGEESNALRKLYGIPSISPEQESPK
ncbi:MAG: hypothetical protein AAB400_00080 [Patescibacteria group bacterium]